MIVVGIDPGPTKSAYAYMYCVGPKIEIYDRGFFTGGPPDVFLKTSVDLFALETVEGYAWLPERSSALIQTAFVTGRIDGFICANYKRITRLSARKWRKIICNNPAASDKTIKRILEARIPKLPRTNAHVRDAIGVALAAIELERRAAVLNRAKLAP